MICGGPFRFCDGVERERTTIGYNETDGGFVRGCVALMADA